jgi:hypothetical protein
MSSPGQPRFRSALADMLAPITLGTLIGTAVLLVYGFVRYA